MPKPITKLLLIVSVAGLVLFVEAERAQAHPDPLENIKIYTYVLTVSPENMYAYLNRGICYRMVSDFSSALEDFDQAETLGASGRYLWMNRAMTRVSLRDFESALLDIDRILEADDNDASSWFYRGEILFRQSKFEEAVENYTKALAVKEAAHVYFVRGDAYKRLGRYEEALADYSKAKKMRPYTIGFLLARAKCYCAMDDFESARADLNEAAEKQPERYQIYIERAILSASQSLEASKTADIALGRRYIEDELFFRPQDSRVFADRARLAELDGKMEEALEDLDRAVEYAGFNDPTFLELRATFFDRQGEGSRAVTDRELAREVENRPVPTATPLPGPTLTIDQLQAQPTPNFLPGAPR